MTSCNNDFETFDVDDITISVNEPIEFADGLDYSIIVKNENKNTVKNLVVNFGYASIDGSGSNDCIMFLAKSTSGNVEIKYMEEVSYHVHVPTKLLKEEMIEFDKIIIDIIGFNNEVTVENRFEKSGPLSGFMKQY